MVTMMFVSHVTNYTKLDGESINFSNKPLTPSLITSILSHLYSIDRMKRNDNRLKIGKINLGDHGQTKFRMMITIICRRED